MTKNNKKTKGFKIGSLFEVQLLYKNLAYLLVLAFVGIVYIANGHRAEKKVRRIQELQGEIEKSKWKYWETRSSVMYEGIQSQTEDRVVDLGLSAGEGSIRILESESEQEEVE